MRIYLACPLCGNHEWDDGPYTESGGFLCKGCGKEIHTEEMVALTGHIEEPEPAEVLPKDKERYKYLLVASNGSRIDYDEKSSEDDARADMEKVYNMSIPAGWDEASQEDSYCGMDEAHLVTEDESWHWTIVPVKAMIPDRRLKAHIPEKNLEKYLLEAPEDRMYFKCKNGKFDVIINRGDYPGIDIEYIPDNEDLTAEGCLSKERPRILFELPSMDGEDKMRALCWSNPHSEDYSEEVIFENGPRLRYYLIKAEEPDGSVYDVYAAGFDEADAVKCAKQKGLFRHEEEKCASIREIQKSEYIS